MTDLEVLNWVKMNTEKLPSLHFLAKAKPDNAVDWIHTARNAFPDIHPILAVCMGAEIGDRIQRKIIFG